MCQADKFGDEAPRRSFLKQGAVALATGLVAAKSWAADIVRPVDGADIVFASGVGSGKAYLAVPSGKGRHPAVLVMHGNIGQPDYQRRIADELAQAGFVALAIERFSRIPGFNWEKLREDDRGQKRFLSERFFLEQQQEARGAAEYLRRHPKVRPGSIGAVGFCGGGIQAVRLSLVVPTVGAIISFYGPPELPPQYKHPTDPIIDLVQIGGRVKAPLQMHYGSGDYAVKAESVDKLASLVRKAGTEVEVHAYAGALHGFYQTPRPEDAESVSLARYRYQRFLHKHLG